MGKKQFLRFNLVLLSALSIVACASNPRVAKQDSRSSEQSSFSETDEAALPVLKEKRFRDRLADGAIGGTRLAAKGTVLAVKGTALAAKEAVTITAEGAGVVAKGAVTGAKVGARVGSRAAVGTGEIIVRGTRNTAKGVRGGMEFVTTAPASKDASSPVGYKSFTDAALSPLSDFNIRKRARPEILTRLKDEDVYQLEANAGCDWYDVRIEELDDVLGDDYDVEKEKVSTFKKIGKNGHSAAISGVASVAGTHIPGRSIVRALSGAKARQKETRRVYQKGVARRSFLKGAALSGGCSGY
ncbi:MAG: hypothetical protein ABJ275_08040 [Maricaulaceae bacterium]